MSLNYRVKTIITSSGERLPFLLDRGGFPVFGPTVFSISEVRARNRSSNTIENYLRSIMVLFVFLDLRSVNLSERLNAGQLLSLTEVEDLVAICRLPLKRVHALISEVEGVPSSPTSSVVKLESVRRRSSVKKSEQVDGNSAATKLRNIRDYLKWLCLTRISKQGVDASNRQLLESAMNKTSMAIDARLPSAYRHLQVEQREGLAPASVNQILHKINPKSQDNPWTNEHAKYRNELIVLWLLHTGMRRGELLNVRIDDINFRTNTVTVVRRADDINDLRVNQPRVKTRGREMPLSAGLMDKTNNYVMQQRIKTRGARKHSFLFTSSSNGAPLSIAALNKLFNVLQSSLPELDGKIFPHVFRHTWNDRFSEEMDIRKVNEEEEKKVRSYLMGWSETSGSAETYTRRHIRKKAQEASIHLQKSILQGENDE